jgi:hypothetical protein
MVERLDPGALLARYYTLSRGPRVCLRLVRSRDADGIRRLCERAGLTLGELELARLVSFDPGTQIVLCATALIDSAETVLGVGVIERGVDRELVPRLVVADEELTDGLAGLLHDALVGHASLLVRARAA